MSKEDALDLLMKNVEKEHKKEILEYVKNLEKELTEDAEQKLDDLTTACKKLHLKLLLKILLLL